MASLASLNTRLRKLERRMARPGYVPESCEAPPATPQQLRETLRTLVECSMFVPAMVRRYPHWQQLGEVLFGSDAYAGEDSEWDEQAELEEEDTDDEQIA